MVVMLLLCVSGIVYIIQPQPTALAAADPMRQAIEESLPAIRRVLEQQGLAERLTIGRRPDHSIIITGWLHDAAEQEQVATAMARVWPMPALRLSNEADLRATALSVLQAYPIRYDARYQGDGVLAIQGIAPDAEQRARTGDMLRAALPGVRLDLGAVLLADEVSQRLAAAAAQAGLPEPQAKWNGARLEITPPDEPEQARRLARVIEEFNPTHLRVATLLPATPAAAPRAVATTVPFAIRSVMGGAQPFVVLGDGTKLVPGGTYRQYRLVSIDNGKVTFDGPTYAVVSADARSLIQETAHGHSRATHHRSGRTAGRAARARSAADADQDAERNRSAVSEAAAGGPDRADFMLCEAAATAAACAIAVLARYPTSADVPREDASALNRGFSHHVSTKDTAWHRPTPSATATSTIRYPRASPPLNPSCDRP